MSESINPENLFLNVTQVAKRYGVSKDTIWRWSSKNELPRPFKVGPNVTRWRLSDLLEREFAFTSSFASYFEPAA